MRCTLGCEHNGTPLHRFPNEKKFPEQFLAWMKVLGEDEENPCNFVQYKTKRICGIHFKKEDRNRFNRLNVLAVPSLHLPMWCNKAVIKVELTQPKNGSKSKKIVLPAANRSSFYHYDHTYSRQHKPVHSYYASDKLTEEESKDVDDDDVFIADNGTKTEIVEPPQMFSWEQEEAEEICLDGYDGDLYTDKETSVIRSHSGKNDQEVPSIKGFVCNSCNTVIERFVYKCVQCFDFDLCGDCERAGEHCTHFLLRVPEDKHRDEVQAVLSRLRQELFTDGLSEIKAEIKDEPTDPGDPIGSPLKTTNADDFHTNTKTAIFLEHRLIEDADRDLVSKDTNIVREVLLNEEASDTEDPITEDESVTISRASKIMRNDSDDFEPNSSESESEEIIGDPSEISRPPAKRPRMLHKGPRRKTTEATAMDTRIVNKKLYVALKPMSIEELAKYKIS